MPDDELKLDVKVGGQEAVNRLSASISLLKDEMDDLTKSFGNYNGTSAEYAKQMAELTAEINRQQKVMDSLGESVEKTSKKQADAGAATKGLRQGVNEITYAIQDFASASGDLSQRLNAISNNIPGMTRMFGNLGGVWTQLAVTAVTAGVAIYANWDKLLELFGGDKAVKGKDRIEELTKSVATLRSEVAGYHSDRAKQLEAEEGALKKVVDQHKEQVKAIEKLKELRPPEEVKREKERAEELQERFGGKQEALIAEVAAGTPEAQKRRETQLAAVQKNIDQVTKEISEEADRMIELGKKGELGTKETEEFLDTQQRRRRQLRKLEELKTKIVIGPMAEATELVAKALVGGKKESVQEILKRLPAASQFREGLEAELTEETTRERERRQKAARDVEKEMEQDKTKEFKRLRQQAEEAARIGKQRQHKEEQDAKQAAAKAKQFREESGRAFERFDKLPGFMGLDAVSAEYAGIPARQRAAYERQQLIPGAAEALRMQHPQMPEEEVQQRAAQYPEFLQQRHRGQVAEFRGAAQMQGIGLGEMAQMEGVSQEALVNNGVAIQAQQAAFQRAMQNLRHMNQQNQQDARFWQDMNGQSVNRLQSFSPGG